MKKLFVALGLALTCMGAAAQTFPDRPLTLVVPYAPGGGSDLLARALGQIISTQTGQSVVVENRPGAATVIGAQSVLAKPADGYTLMAVAASFVINPHLLKLPYNQEKDFQAVTLMATNPHVLVVNNDVPAKTLPELVAWAKANPGKGTFSSFGNGSSGHIGFEQFKQIAEIDMLHVPYKGAAPATMAVLSGEVSATLGDIGNVTPHIKAGRLKAIAITGEKRATLLPDVPTFAESGLPDYFSQTWLGLWTRSGVPQDRLQRLNELFGQALKRPEIRELLAEQGTEPKPTTIAEFDAFAKAESNKYKQAIEKAGIRIE